MKNLTIVALSLLLVSSVLFMAFKPAPTPVQANDHIVLMQNNAEVFISINGIEFEAVKAKTKSYGIVNANPIIEQVKKYEAQNYKIISTSIGSGATMIWMTKSN